MRWSSKLAQPLGVMVLAGCQTPVPDPPPPVSKAELPSAAPRAVGALAAGTDAAPRPDPSAPQEPDRGDFLPYPDGPPGAHGGSSGSGSGSGGASAAPAPQEPNSVQL